MSHANHCQCCLRREQPRGPGVSEAQADFARRITRALTALDQSLSASLGGRGLVERAVAILEGRE